MTRTTQDGFTVTSRREGSLIYLCVIHDDMPGGLATLYVEPEGVRNARRRLLRQSRQMLSEARSERSEVYPDTESRCPACGEFISYCSGHGEMGDPYGFAALVEHDSDNHSLCNERSECREGWSEHV